MAKKTGFEDILKNIDVNRTIITVIPLLQPFIIFGSWLIFARMNKNAGIVSKIIAIAEPIPTIDLNVPKEVVLASLFDSTGDALLLLEKVIDLVIDTPAEVKDSIDKAKKGIVYQEGPITVTTSDLWELTKERISKVLKVVI